MKSKVYIYIHNSHGKFCKNLCFWCPIFFAPKKTPTKSVTGFFDQRPNRRPCLQHSGIFLPMFIHIHRPHRSLRMWKKTLLFLGMNIRGVNDKKVTQICFLILDDDIWYMWLYLNIYAVPPFFGKVVLLFLANWTQSRSIYRHLSHLLHPKIIKCT